jgi:hypothetical protein
MRGQMPPMPPGTGTLALSVLFQQLVHLQVLADNGLVAGHGYDSVSLRARGDARNAHRPYDPKRPFLFHSLWNPPKGRPSAHARMAGAQLDTEVSKAWIETQRLLGAFVGSLASTLQHLGVQRCAVASVGCEATGRDAVVQFGLRLCTPHDDSSHETANAVFGHEGADRWRERAVRQVSTLDGLQPPPDGAPYWKVVVDELLPSPFCPVTHYGPYQAVSPEQALTLCKALDYPELFHRTNPQIQILAHPGP